MFDETTNLLKEWDQQGQAEELAKVESEYMRMKLEAEDEANRLQAPLELMD